VPSSGVVSLASTEASARWIETARCARAKHLHLIIPGRAKARPGTNGEASAELPADGGKSGFEKRRSPEQLWASKGPSPATHRTPQGKEWVRAPKAEPGPDPVSPIGRTPLPHGLPADQRTDPTAKNFRHRIVGLPGSRLSVRLSGRCRGTSARPRFEAPMNGSAQRHHITFEHLEADHFAVMLQTHLAAVARAYQPRRIGSIPVSLPPALDATGDEAKHDHTLRSATDCGWTRSRSHPRSGTYTSVTSVTLSAAEATTCRRRDRSTRRGAGRSADGGKSFFRQGHEAEAAFGVSWHDVLRA
jgi:hypothetical protein